jgi:hypothetical protein
MLQLRSDEVTGGWKKLRNWRLRHSCSSEDNLCCLSVHVLSRARGKLAVGDSTNDFETWRQDNTHGIGNQEKAGR